MILLGKSLPAREEWIEMRLFDMTVSLPSSLPAREEWIEIVPRTGGAGAHTGLFPRGKSGLKLLELTEPLKNI